MIPGHVWGRERKECLRPPPPSSPWSSAGRPRRGTCWGRGRTPARTAGPSSCSTAPWPVSAWWRWWRPAPRRSSPCWGPRWWRWPALSWPRRRDWRRPGGRRTAATRTASPDASSTLRWRTPPGCRWWSCSGWSAASRQEKVRRNIRSDQIVSPNTGQRSYCCSRQSSSWRTSRPS